MENVCSNYNLFTAKKNKTMLSNLKNNGCVAIDTIRSKTFVRWRYLPLKSLRLRLRRALEATKAIYCFGNLILCNTSFADDQICSPGSWTREKMFTFSTLVSAFSSVEIPEPTSSQRPFAFLLSHDKI